MDITNFISWFLNVVSSIFSDVFGILNNITFAGTSLLKFMLTIVILSTLLPVLLTIANSQSIGRVAKSEKVTKKGEKNDK